METVRGVPAGGTPGRSGRPPLGARSLYGQGQRAPRGEVDAAPTPEDRIYTVICGFFYIGLGDEFDADKLAAYPPGAVIILPGNTSHFHWAKSGGYVTQVTASGPLGLEYVNSKDDPRNVSSTA